MLINIKAGAKVTEDEEVIAYEAMKSKNHWFFLKKAIIKEIKVRRNRVNEGDPRAVLEIEIQLPRPY